VECQRHVTAFLHLCIGVFLWWDYVQFCKATLTERLCAVVPWQYAGKAGAGP